MSALYKPKPNTPSYDPPRFTPSTPSARTPNTPSGGSVSPNHSATTPAAPQHQTPYTNWSQSPQQLFLKLDVVDSVESSIQLVLTTAKTLSFQCNTKSGDKYNTVYNLYEAVDVPRDGDTLINRAQTPRGSKDHRQDQVSHLAVPFERRGNAIYATLTKLTPLLTGGTWPRLLSATTKNQRIKVWFDRQESLDAELEEQQPNVTGSNGQLTDAQHAENEARQRAKSLHNGTAVENAKQIINNLQAKTTAAVVEPVKETVSKAVAAAAPVLSAVAPAAASKLNGHSSTSTSATSKLSDQKSQATSSAAPSASRPSSNSTITQLYLTLYNTITLGLWMITALGGMSLLSQHDIGSAYDHPNRSKLTTAFYEQYSSTAYLAQALSTLEIVHILLGLTAGNLSGSVMLNLGRNVIMAVIYYIPALHTHFSVYVLFMLWAFSDTIRFAYYTIGSLATLAPDVPLQNGLTALKKLRTTIPLVTFPLGVASELWVLWTATNVRHSPFVSSNAQLGLLAYVLLAYTTGPAYLYLNMIQSFRRGGASLSSRVAPAKSKAL